MSQSTNQFDGLLQSYEQFFQGHQADRPMTLLEYVELAHANPSVYQSAHSAMVEAFGKPSMFNTRDDSRLGRIYENKTIQIFPAFEQEFFGMHHVIEELYSYFLRGAQGLDERHKILYLLGPVGGGKSSLAEKLKELAETVPFYVLAYQHDDGTVEPSPVFESPLGLFSESGFKEKIMVQTGIPKRAFPTTMSPWARKRRQQSGGNLEQFRVLRMFPSIVEQLGIGVATPGDESNQDVSTLVGKVDIRQLEDHAQNDPDAYSFSGALCRGQRLMEFVEMFKAPIKTLNPLLTATMERVFHGTEQIGAIPFGGVIIAHSNEAEWEKFKGQRQNEAFLDRITLVKVPYVLAVSDEVKIYQKLIQGSELATYPCAPGTLETLARFSVLTRIGEPHDGTLLTKLRVYDGENLKDTDVKAKPIHEYREHAGVNEGMAGESTRFAYDILARTYNFDPSEIAANPVHLMVLLANAINHKYPSDDEKKKRLLGVYLKEICQGELRKQIEEVIKECYLDAADESGQSIFERYIILAEHWIEQEHYRDPDTNQTLDRDAINKELESIEKPAGIANPKDFRNEIVRLAYKEKAHHEGKLPSWRLMEKIRPVIEKKLFARVEDMLPVVSFSRKETSELEAKHDAFLTRMIKRGYTEKQVRLLVEWHIRMKNNS